VNRPGSFRAWQRCSLCLPQFLLIAALVALVPSAHSAEPEAPTTTQVFTLPPLTIEQSDVPWFIVEAPGFEILSQLRQPETLNFFAGYKRLYRLLSLILPESLRVRSDVPERIIIYKRGTKSQTIQQITAEMEKSEPEHLTRRKPYYPTIIFAPNLAIRDGDAPALFALLPDDDPDTRVALLTGGEANGVVSPGDLALSFSPSELGVLIRQRTPRPPAWFIEGFVTFYQDVTFSLESAILNPMIWISLENTREIKKHADRPPNLLPLRDVLTDRGDVSDPSKQAFRQAETALFIRWCLDAKKHTRRDALWGFVAQAAVREPDEAMFRQAFGLSETEVLEQLGDYLPNAVRKTVELKFEPASKPSSAEPPPPGRPLVQRRASPDEIARIKGGWQRLEITFVKDRVPELLPSYVAQARQTLMQAYNNGDRDPNLLAEIGLFECDIGDSSTARSFLESAAAAEVISPRVYVELAKLRLAEALPPPGLPGKLTEGDAGKILALLNQGRAQSPPQLETYLLICQCLTNRDQPLAPAEITALEEGLALFPHQMDLRYNIAAAEAHGGSAEAARTIVDGALKENLNSDDRSAFAELRASLQRSP